MRKLMIMASMLAMVLLAASPVMAQDAGSGGDASDDSIGGAGGDATSAQYNTQLCQNIFAPGDIGGDQSADGTQYGGDDEVNIEGDENNVVLSDEQAQEIANEQNININVVQQCFQQAQQAQGEDIVQSQDGTQTGVIGDNNDGVDGTDGVDGVDGQDGVDGVEGQDGADGAAFAKAEASAFAAAQAFGSGDAVAQASASAAAEAFANGGTFAEAKAEASAAASANGAGQAEAVAEAAATAAAEANGGATAAAAAEAGAVAVGGDTEAAAAAGAEAAASAGAEDEVDEGQYVAPEADVEDDTAVAPAEVEDEAVVAPAEVEAEEGSVAVLPDTGGASLFTLGAGALLVAGGLLARRIVR